MADAELAISYVLAELEPTPVQKEGAKRSHRYLREQLAGGKIGERIVDSYLSGSYSRDTAIQPLDDVDIIFVIEPDGWDRPMLSRYPSPTAVLRTFEGAIRYRYQESSLRMQRVSVRFQLDHVDIDVVPAITDDEDDELLRIPDSHDDKWVLTAPKKHTWHATEVNKLRGGLFKPLVKLLKGWNAGLPDSARMKSFAVETMAVRVFYDMDFATLDEGALMFWDFLAWHGGAPALYEWADAYDIGLKNWTPSVPDVAETGSNTIGRPTREMCKRFMAYARQSRDCLGAALRARTQERTDRLVRQALRQPE